MFKKLQEFKYLRRRVVLLADIMLSLVAVNLAYVFMLSLYHNFDNAKLMLSVNVATLLVSCFVFAFSSIHKEVIRHFSINSIIKVIYVALIKSFVVTIVALYVMNGSELPVYAGIIDFLVTSLFMIGIRSSMVVIYYYLIDRTKHDVQNCFVYSTRGSNPSLVEQLDKDTKSKYRVKGFITTNKAKVGTRISGEKVYDVENAELVDILKLKTIFNVIFTSKESFDLERSRLVELCIQNNIRMLMMGGIESLGENGEFPKREIKPIQIEDLLERKEINVDIEKIASEIEDKVVMVTGAAGSIGREISLQIASFGAKKLILFDVAETPLHNLQLEMSRLYPGSDKIAYILGDVRSQNRVNTIMGRYKPSIIFHAAAYKHVPMIEANPCEGVLANVWGTTNVAQCAIRYGVSKFVMVSTDKAVNPTNIMGSTKRIAEICVQKMNLLSKTEFITTRFGNVLGSNGSVIPLFKDQIAAGGPVTVTHPDIIRYFMTIPEACRLVLQAATMGHAGEILVFDMGEQVKIVDLAKKMIRLSGFEPEVDIKISYTGLRPGEKLYEELLTPSETTTATSHQKIRIAQSNIDYREDLESLIKEAILVARVGDIQGTVALIKQIVPEYNDQKQ